jgi:hypothetical protein
VDCGTGCCEDVNEHSGSIKCGFFLVKRGTVKGKAIPLRVWTDP